MMVQSPLKKKNIRPNLRKVPLPGKGSSNKKKGKTSHSIKYAVKKGMPKITPWKVILGSLAIGVFGLLYLTHVFSTQSLLEEVQVLQADYNRSRAQYDELKLRYDRMVGPAEIYRKAEEQGFINGGPADQIIIIKE
jgi:hypothetical protein